MDESVTLLAVRRRTGSDVTSRRVADAVTRIAAANGGSRYEDDLLVGFPTAAAALTAANEVQQAVACIAESDAPLSVGIGVHTGPAAPAEKAATVRRCLDVRDVAVAGQTIVTAAAATALGGKQPPCGRLVDVGRHRLQDLAGAIELFALDTEGRPESELVPASLETLPNNLPGQLTHFVGRHDELSEVSRLLREHRLVTVAGPGGAGKSRLAAQALARTAADLPDGVWWVDLGSVTDDEHVLPAVGTALRLPAEPWQDSAAVLAERIRDRRLILCLDTCEHLVDVCAELAATLLRQCPGVSVIATSREPLGVPGEFVWRIPPLPTTEGAELFRDRALMARGGVAVQADEEDVAALAQRLDGMPLAIELAAVWSVTLTPRQIVAGLEDRLELTAWGPRATVPRQQTLAASMRWSHDLLDDRDRIVFRRLAAFRGEFDLAAAEAVCADEHIPAADVLTRIGRLVVKSLVVAHAVGPGIRYRLLDTIRQYAEVQLAASGESAALADRHLDHFLAVAEGASAAFEQNQDAERARLTMERDNLRSALSYGLTVSEPVRGRRLAAALASWWFVTGQAHEGIGVLRRALARAPEERTELSARLETGLAMLGMISGRFAMSEQSSKRAAALAAEVGDEFSRGRALVMGAYRWFLFDLDKCRQLARDAHLVGDAAGDLFTRDWATVLEAYTYIVQDRYDEARDLGQRAYALSQPRGDRFTAGFARSLELWEAYGRGDLARACTVGHEAAELVSPLGDFFASGTIVVQLATMRGLLGGLADARALCDPVARVFESTPDVDVVGVMVAIGELHLWAGELAEAEHWLGRGSRFAAPAEDNWTAARSLPGLAKTLRLTGRMEEARAAALRGVELARRFEGVAIWAQALDELALATAPDDPVAAEALHQEALGLRVDRGVRVHQVDSLDALAARAAETGSLGEATRLLAASDVARAAMGYPRPDVDAPSHARLVASLREGLRRDFDAEWSAGAQWSLDDAVAFVRRARGSRDRPSSGWASLTPTEVEVVRRVADGLTNPEVGRQLFMSLSTVKTHLSHVFAKLGISNRTELTRLALRYDR